MSVSAGSLSAIFPAVVIALIGSQYFKTRNIKWILWLGVFLLFGIIGNKRVLIFLIPGIILLEYLYYAIKFKEYLTFHNILVLLITVVLVYGAIRMVPSLNPENKIFGTFNMAYTANYVEDYVTTDKRDYRQLELRRKAGLVYFYNYLKNKDTLTYLFGEGPGNLVQTDFRKRSATMIDVYGVRYGGRMGIIWIYLQVGLLGAIIWLFLWFYVFFKLYKSKGTDIYTIAAMLTFFIIMFDVGIYSYVTIRYFPIFSLWALFSSLAYRRNVLGYNETYDKKSHYFFTSFPVSESESFGKHPLLPTSWVRLKF